MNTTQVESPKSSVESQTAQTPLWKNRPHPEIQHVSNLVIGLYKQQRAYLASKESGFLHDIISAAHDVKNHEHFSIRVAAEVNSAAAVMILEERKR